MRAGDRAEGQDERNQRGSGGDGIGEKRERHVAPERRSPMIPEPTTAATRKAVPRNSERMRLGRVAFIVGR